jgi:hypothetical protein
MMEKIALAAASAMLSGGLTVAMNTANTAGRLTAVETSLGRIERRLDAAFPPPPAVARAQATQERAQ